MHTFRLTSTREQQRFVAEGAKKATETFRGSGSQLNLFRELQRKRTTDPDYLLTSLNLESSFKQSTASGQESQLIIDQQTKQTKLNPNDVEAQAEQAKFQEETINNAIKKFRASGILTIVFGVVDVGLFTAFLCELNNCK